MCTNKKWVYNNYSHRSVLVSCGKCKSCLQQKANKRRLRLLNHLPDGYDVYFFHLTYADEFVPYIYIDDIIPQSDGILDIYRMMEVDVSYSPKYKCCVYNYKYDYVNKENKVAETSYSNVTLSELEKLHQLKNGRIGVLVYSDVQKFFKRLRSRLNRIDYVKKNLEQKPLYYFCTGEYGETYSRPHWHILLYVPRIEGYGFEFIKRTCVSCWSYGYDYITEKRFEYAISPETYVSQYINASVDVSPFLLRSKIRPTWHYSHGFGRFNPSFSLGFILQQIRKGSFEYNQEFTFKHGRKLSFALPFPSYVTDRFFPKFKGLRTLSYAQLCWFIQLCLSNEKVSKKTIVFAGFPVDFIYSPINYLHLYEYKLELDVGDIEKIISSLKNAYMRYKRYHNLSDNYDCSFAYACDYVNMVSAKQRWLLNKQLSVVPTDRDIIQSYDNVQIIHDCNPVYFGMFFSGNYFSSPFIVHPNEFDENRKITLRLTDKYNKYVKQKKSYLCLKN